MLRTKPTYFKLYLILALFLTFAIRGRAVSAEPTPTYQGGRSDCTIPESGPWPPCATGTNAPTAPTDDQCIIPELGPWPACAIGGDKPTVTDPECEIPQSGPWPPCATSGDTPDPATPEPCPLSGPWPPNCVPVEQGDVTNEDELRVRIELALDQLAAYWQPELADQGVEYRDPSTVEIFVGEEDEAASAFYSPSADAVFIDLRLLDELAADYGEYAAVAVLAHEWGHFIQDLLQLLTNDRPLRQIELQADCFTGSFTTYLNQTDQLAEGEYQSARTLFYSIGDDIVNPDAPYNQPGAHGTGEERQTAFDYGWNSSFFDCLNRYQ